MEIVNKEIVEFINDKRGLINGELGKLQEKFYEAGLPIIDIETANFLEQLLLIKKPKNILEVGLAVGFSSSLMATTLPDSKITSIERWELMLEKGKVTHEKLGLTKQINVIHGDGLEVLKNLSQESEKFDFIFLDCAKGQYIYMLEYCLNILNKDGIIFIDDIFQKGNIVKNIEEIERRQRTIYRRMHEFIDALVNNPNLKTNILPIADGVILVNKIN